MKFSSVELASNRKFELFFTVFFVIVASYLGCQKNAFGV